MKAELARLQGQEAASSDRESVLNVRLEECSKHRSSLELQLAKLNIELLQHTMRSRNGRHIKLNWKPDLMVICSASST